MPSIVNALARATITEIAPVLSRTADGASAAFDLGPYEGIVAFVFSIGAASAGVDPTMTVSLTESDASAGSYTAVTGGAGAEVTTTAATQTVLVDCNKVKQFLKANWDIGGTSAPAFPVGVLVIGQKKYA